MYWDLGIGNILLLLYKRSKEIEEYHTITISKDQALFLLFSNPERQAPCFFHSCFWSLLLPLLHILFSPLSISSNLSVFYLLLQLFLFFFLISVFYFSLSIVFCSVSLSTLHLSLDSLPSSTLFLFPFPRLFLFFLFNYLFPLFLSRPFSSSTSLPVSNLPLSLTHLILLPLNPLHTIQEVQNGRCTSLLKAYPRQER